MPRRPRRQSRRREPQPRRRRSGSARRTRKIPPRRRLRTRFEWTAPRESDCWIAPNGAIWIWQGSPGPNLRLNGCASMPGSMTVSVSATRCCAGAPWSPPSPMSERTHRVDSADSSDASRVFPHPPKPAGSPADGGTGAAIRLFPRDFDVVLLSVLSSMGVLRSDARVRYRFGERLSLEVDGEIFEMPVPTSSGWRASSRRTDC